MRIYLAFIVSISVVALPDWPLVKKEIIKIMTTDNNIYTLNDLGESNYGPFFIRLVWHCAGTYRASDGRGGCEGGRIRFYPEIGWGSNVNLDKAIQMLKPIYEQFKNSSLSWSDLIVLTGNTAIEEMGGPTINFCGGREDDSDGNASKPLNNEDIYLPADTLNASRVRESFKIMDMNDQETVALIGGGHAFGRCHIETSGFQGPWTHTPTTFSNQFLVHLYKNRANYTDQNITYKGKTLKQKFNTKTSLMMLMTDYVLMDDSAYIKHVKRYAENEALLKSDFGAAWEKLMNRDMGAKDCVVNKDKKEPDSSSSYLEMLVDLEKDIKKLLRNENADYGNYGPFFVRHAWHCAGTYRSTDHRGGCNGARIRFDPELSWESNKGIKKGLDLLRPIKNKYKKMSWGDLIIFTGTIALTSMGARRMPFCGGRVDQNEAQAKILSKYLEPTIYLAGGTGTASQLKESMQIMGFTIDEMTVLIGGGHSIGRAHTYYTGFDGPWTSTPTKFSNSYFRTLLDNTWVEDKPPKGMYHDKKTSQLMMLKVDLELKNDQEFRKAVDKYYNDENLFQDDFAKAWVKLVNSDIGFGTNCKGFSVKEIPNPTASPTKSVTSKATQLEYMVDIMFLSVLVFLGRK